MKTHLGITKGSNVAALIIAILVAYCFLAIVKFHQKTIISLNQPDNQLYGTINLAPAEDWGSWTDGSPLILRLYKPLPKFFTLKISLKHIAQPIVDKRIYVTIGGTKRDFIAKNTGDVFLSFRNVKSNSKLITINIPETLSPLKSGTGTDTRNLGLGIADIQITNASVF